MFRLFQPLLIAAFVVAATALPAAAQPKAEEWTVDGIKREALVFPPSQKSNGPMSVMFVFHGHGGSMRAMGRLGFQQLWPEAIIVCPQGLPTATRRDPDGERSGWQPGAGTNGDRDLKFVDAMLKTLRERFTVDNRRVFVTGHSNGGRFTYLLGAKRGEVFAAIAPVAAGAGAVQKTDETRPLPVLHVAGQRDAIVPFASQQRTMELVRAHNGCDPVDKPWATAGELVGTIYASKTGTPFVEVISPGTHKYPAEAPRLIVRFFKEVSQNRPTSG